MAELPYQVDHDGVRCRIVPRSERGLQLFMVAGIVASLGVMGAVTTAVAGQWIVGSAIAAATVMAMAVPIALAIRRRAARLLVCQGRTLTIAIEGLGGWGSRPTQRSLLALYRAAATADGWLVLEPDPGPSEAVWLDAGGLEPQDRQAIAEALTAAFDRAEAHRGDYPVARTREMERLLER